MGRTWIEGHVELLIDTIKKYEKLWNTKHPGYTDGKKIRHRYWKEITKQFNDIHDDRKYPPYDVQYKWNNLRLKFQKEQKKDSSTWRFYNSLLFLAGHPSRKREKRLVAPKKYSLRTVGGKRRCDSDTDVSIGSISPRNRREKNENEVSFIAQQSSTNTNDVKTDEETDYVSIGSVSPPYIQDNVDDSREFYI